jgi:hypothetical protein
MRICTTQTFAYIYIYIYIHTSDQVIMQARVRTYLINGDRSFGLVCAEYHFAYSGLSAPKNGLSLSSLQSAVKGKRHSITQMFCLSVWCGVSCQLAFQ